MWPRAGVRGGAAQGPGREGSPLDSRLLPASCDMRSGRASCPRTGQWERKDPQQQVLGLTHTRVGSSDVLQRCWHSGRRGGSARVRRDEAGNAPAVRGLSQHL